MVFFLMFDRVGAEFFADSTTSKSVRPVLIFLESLIGNEKLICKLHNLFLKEVDYLAKFYYICTQFNNNYKLHHESTHN